jgi:hypothetical protein
MQGKQWRAFEYGHTWHDIECLICALLRPVLLFINIAFLNSIITAFVDVYKHFSCLNAQGLDIQFCIIAIEGEV